MRWCAGTTPRLAGTTWWQVDNAFITACEPIPANPAITLDKTVGTDPVGLRGDRRHHRDGRHGRDLLLRGRRTPAT
ncbi:MAG: hypothetical protein V9H69_07945 [Anaerolineae bacterium]